MRTTWTKLSAAASIALAAACGGSGNGTNAALSKSFTYGPPAAPTTSETTAANSAQGNLADTKSFGATPSAAKGAAIVSFADSLAILALGGAAVPIRGPSSSDIQSAMRNAIDVSTCTTSTANSVTFNNCTIIESGFTITLNGSISVTANVVTWAITGGFSGTNQGVTVNVVNHQSGTLTLTDTTVKGNAVSDFGGSVSGNGQSVNFGLATAVVIDVTYQSAPTVCVTSGTIEVKRVWTTKPNGATGPAFADLAVKLTWSGCNIVTVAHSV
jgi:hypothetical protein